MSSIHSEILMQGSKSRLALEQIYTIVVAKACMLLTTRFFLNKTSVLLSGSMCMAKMCCTDGQIFRLPQPVALQLGPSFLILQEEMCMGKCNYFTGVK